MREWVLVFIPVVIIVYFIVYPDQFAALMAWTMFDKRSASSHVDA